MKEGRDGVENYDELEHVSQNLEYLASICVCTMTRRKGGHT